jgi:Zn-dependent protease
MLILLLTGLINLSQFVYLLCALLVGLSFHEASHALVAYWLGDDTPKRMGRLSLNPLAHLEPIGLLSILLIGIGWGRPVGISAEKLRTGPKLGMALVAIAGPITNILLAIALAAPLRLHWVSFAAQSIFALGRSSLYLSTGCLDNTLVALSLGLAVFNLIPFAPLDGSRLWQIILPTRWYYVVARYEIIGVAVIIGLVLADLYLQTGVLSRIIYPPLQFLWKPIVGFGQPLECIVQAR